MVETKLFSYTAEFVNNIIHDAREKSCRDAGLGVARPSACCSVVASSFQLYYGYDDGLDVLLMSTHGFIRAVLVIVTPLLAPFLQVATPISRCSEGFRVSRLRKILVEDLSAQLLPPGR